jgi:hypothetical protein
MVVQATLVVGIYKIFKPGATAERAILDTHKIEVAYDGMDIIL